MRWRFACLAYGMWLMSICSCEPLDDVGYVQEYPRAARARRNRVQSESGRRHIILMIGDGMPLVSEVATSRYLHGTDYGLSFQALPHRSFVTTWDVDVYNARADEFGVDHYSAESFDPTVGYNPELGGKAPYPIVDDTDAIREYFSYGGWIYPDSASTATAMSTGIKTNSGAIAWLPGAGDQGAIETSAELLRRVYGMSIGLVTTVPFSHATPAGFFSHNPSRGNYTSIANEILNVVRPEVVIGGGYQNSGYYDEMDLERAVASNDWIFSHWEEGVDSNDALLAASVRANQANKRLLGIYGGGDRADHIVPIPANAPGNPQVDDSMLDRPTLPNASIAALEVLSRDPDGFFLLIEQGHIDWANHAQDFNGMIGCVWELDQAVQAVTQFVDRPDDEVDWSNTTLIVTADHSNGYMRFGRTMGKGELRREVTDTSSGTVSYPDGEVTYFSPGTHTSELVDVYAKGFAAAKIHDYEYVYPGCKIMDDASIYRLTLDAAQR